MGLNGVLRITEGNGLGFWCPGCEEMHVVSPAWTFDGNYDRPTFSPSVLVTNGHYTPGFKPGGSCACNFAERHPDQGPWPWPCSRCHSFVVDGKIQFLGDCTHKLAGQTVALEAPR